MLNTGADNRVVLLPGGLWAEGRLQREAKIRPLTGYDEEYLAGLGEAVPLAQRTTEVLLRTVRSLGSLHPIDRDMVRSLTVGDREALLLHLRRLTLGDRLNCIVRCPDLECSEAMDLELSCSRLLLPTYEDPRPVFDRTIVDGGKDYYVRFRSPNGHDQEAAAPIALRNLSAAYSCVMKRCVERVVARDSGREIADYPEGIARGIARAMAEVDPQAELRLSAVCTACESPFSVLLDAAMFFFREIEARGKQLYHQVHRLASRYHWAESEILRMTPRKRERYLSFLSEAAAFV